MVGVDLVAIVVLRLGDSGFNVRIPEIHEKTVSSVRFDPLVSVASFDHLVTLNDPNAA